MEDGDLAQLAASIVVAMIERGIVHSSADVLKAIDDVKTRLLRSGPQEQVPDDIPEGLEGVLQQ